MMLSIIKSFNGDPEQFYTQLYNTFSSTENILKLQITYFHNSLDWGNY